MSRSGAGSERSGAGFGELVRTHGRWQAQDAPQYWAAIVASLMPAAVPVNRWLLVTAPDCAKEAALEELERYCRAGNHLLIDSGVFGLAMAAAKKRGVDHNEGLRTPPEQIEGWERFMQQWKQVIDRMRDLCWGYIEIDLGGTEQKRKTRAALEAEGYRPIPVIHPLQDGWDYFDEMADRYDRLCIGNLVTAKADTRFDILRTVAERRKGRRVQWIHALGVTAGPLWLSVRTESCDSSTPASPLRWGMPMHATSAFHASDLPDMPYLRAAGVEAYAKMTRHLYRDAAFLGEAVNIHA